MLELNIKDYFENDNNFYIFVNNKLFGTVNNDDDFNFFVSKVIDTIKIKKPNYQLVVNENKDSITLNVISPGFIKNGYYVYNITKEPARKLQKDYLEIEIEHPSGSIDELII
jgi:hypothetical protein